MKSALYYLMLLLPMMSFAQAKKEMYQFSKDIASKIEADTMPWRYQLGATDYSFSGYYKKAIETWDKNGSGVATLSKEDSLYFKTFKPEKATDYIIQRSKIERVIIINEAHHNSMHRVFTTSLLQGLYNNGYRFFGLEAIDDTLINQRKFVATQSGYYTQEPQMANLIHEAIQIGFTIFSYEASEDKNGKEREIEQAENISKVMNNNPVAKFLIHCGWDHVIEGTPRNKSWGKAMAGRMKDITGIDPFTIDQTNYSEKGDLKYNSPYIQLVGLNFPVIMVDEKGKTFNGGIENDQTDCSIIHPITTYIHEKPNWLSLSGKRKTYRIPIEKTTAFPVLVLAYRLGEFEKKGIPVDVFEFSDKQQTGTLLLKKGKYNIIMKDKQYNIIHEYEVKI